MIDFLYERKVRKRIHLWMLIFNQLSNVKGIKSGFLQVVNIFIERWYNRN